jgi:hypothetical protein
MIYALPKLDWFQHDCDSFETICMACLAGINAVFNDIPAAWLGPPRKQLSAKELAQRTAVVWDIPMAKLEALLSEGSGALWSSKSYVAGTGLRLCAKLHREDDAGPYSLGVYIHLADYTLEGQKLVPVPITFSCTYDVQRLVPGESQPHKILEESEALDGTSGWGISSVLTASSLTDLGPHLVDGCLKLRLYVHKIM